MSQIILAIEKLEKILDRNICFSRREELQDVLNLLKEELESMNGSRLQNDDEDDDNNDKKENDT